MGFPGGSAVKNLPAMQETEVRLAAHFSTFAREIPWTEEAGGLQSLGSKELDMT